MAARDSAKKKMKKFPIDSLEYNVYNGQQLAFKVACNSLYGFLGARSSPLPAVRLAATITALGRRNLRLAKEHMLTRFQHFANPNESIDVLYGDTDSVFCRYVGVTLERAGVIAQQLEQDIKVHFKDRQPMELTLEKYFSPFLLLGKKSYCATKYTKPGSAGELSFTGVEIARRDKTKFIKDLQLQFVTDIMINRDIELAKANARCKIETLMNGTVNIDDLRLSKKLSAKVYKSEPKYIQSWRNQVLRCGVDNSPRLGDPFHFVVTGFSKNLEYTDLPLVKQHNIQPNIDHYWELCVNKPMGRMFKHVLSINDSSTILDKKSYNRTTTCTARRGNLLSFCGVTKITKTIGGREKQHINFSQPTLVEPTLIQPVKKKPRKESVVSPPISHFFK